MKKLIYPLVIFLVAGFVLGVVFTARTSQELKVVKGINTSEPAKYNGEYIVEVNEDGRWLEVSRLRCDRFFREQSVDLAAMLPDEGLIEVRVQEQGGGDAHIDTVLLGGTRPLSVNGKSDGVEYKKIASKDNDVIKADDRTFTIAFDAGRVTKDKKLRLAARVESEQPRETPFQFPLKNLHNEITESSDFYTYQVAERPANFIVDGNLAEVSNSEPLFNVWSITGSGHPNGYTYGWVSNDEKHLYVALDFTPDNTPGGDNDYAKVYVKTDNGVKAFEISKHEKRWGATQFVYTDKVNYEHRVYEFAIPLAEIDPHDGELCLAFAAYGSAFPSTMAYDPWNNQFLSVSGDGSGGDVFGQFINADGTPAGTDFIICNAADLQERPVVAIDPANSRYLVAWADYRNGGANPDIYGQVVNADGTPFATATDVNFPICNQTNTQLDPALAYDSGSQRYLCAWTDFRNGVTDIYGQLVDSGGTLLENASNANFPISRVAASNQDEVALACDTVNQRFLAVFVDNRIAPLSNDIYGQLVNTDGTLFGTAVDVNFPVCNEASTQERPCAAYDSTNGRFLAAWEDHRNPTRDIYGQLLNADGSPSGTATNVNFPICNQGSNQFWPSVAYNSAHQRYLTVWSDNRNPNQDVYGQLVNPDGSPFDTATDVNFLVAELTDDLNDPRVVYNSLFANYLVVFYYLLGGGGDYTEGFAPVGAEQPANAGLDTTSLDFGLVLPGNTSDPQTLTVTNNGTGGELMLGDVLLTGPDAADFAIQNDNISGQTLQQGESRTVEVVFSPDRSAAEKLPLDSPFMLAGLPLLLLGGFFALRQRKRVALLLVVVLFASMLVVSCSGRGGDEGRSYYTGKLGVTSTATLRIISNDPEAPTEDVTLTGLVVR